MGKVVNINSRGNIQAEYSDEDVTAGLVSRQDTGRVYVFIARPEAAECAGMGLTPRQARALAISLIEQAEEAEKMNGTPR